MDLDRDRDRDRDRDNQRMEQATSQEVFLFHLLTPLLIGRHSLRDRSLSFMDRARTTG